MKKARRVVSHPRGFTFVETLISTLLVSLLLVAALGGLGSLIRHRLDGDLQLLAKMHADEVLSEILEKPYVDPNGESVPQYVLFIRIGDKLGPEGQEADGTRSRFDDVDDYDKWTGSPLKRRDGSVLPDRENWTRKVSVRYVRPTSPSQSTIFDEGVKRITITVWKDGEQLAEVVAFRTQVWDQMP